VLTDSKSGTSLTRAYSLLTEDQRRSEIVEKYSGCKPGTDLNPFALLTGTAKYLEQGGRLSLSQHNKIARHVAEARYRFKADSGTAAAVNRLDAML
jgi:hypothetical protein